MLLNGSITPIDVTFDRFNDCPLDSVVGITGDVCSKKFYFGQVKDVLFDYALGKRRMTGSLPAIAQGQVMPIYGEVANTIEDAAEAFVASQGYEYFETRTLTGDLSGILDVKSPTFTPGQPIVQKRETGGYDEFIGESPSEFSFKVDTMNPQLTSWARRFLHRIPPMSYGMYLINQAGDLLGIQVCLCDGWPESSNLWVFAPIPILSIRKESGGLGDLDNPALTQYSVILPPYWDAPYRSGMQLSSQICGYNTLPPTVQASGLCLIPRKKIDSWI